MGPEAKLYQKLKRNFKSISLIRIENNSLLGTPDLLGYNNSGHFFTIELKVTKGNKIKFSPHQIAFHVRHPKNTFIIIQHLGQGTVKLFRGSRILELEACGFKLDACCLGLDACRLELEACGL
jgi:Holliday junction resolvase